MKEEVMSEIGRIVKNLGRKDVLAAGLFGSMARGDFNERSDIDIFIITEKELGIKEQDEFYYAFSERALSIMEAKRDAERLVEGGYRVGEKVLKEFHAMLEEEETG